MTQQLTKADQGLIVHENMTLLYQMALKKGSLAERQLAKSIYDQAVTANIEATGVRLNRADSLDNITNAEKAAVLSFAIRTAREFLINQFKDVEFQFSLAPSGAKLRNVVDMREYRHFATVTSKGKTYRFCIHTDGKYILSDSNYWESIA